MPGAATALPEPQTCCPVHLLPTCLAGKEGPAALGPWHFLRHTRCGLTLTLRPSSVTTQLRHSSQVLPPWASVSPSTPGGTAVSGPPGQGVDGLCLGRPGGRPPSTPAWMTSMPCAAKWGRLALMETETTAQCFLTSPAPHGSASPGLCNQ